MKTLRKKIRRAYEWSRDKLNGAALTDDYFFAHVGSASLAALREQLEELGRSFWLNAPRPSETEIVVAADEICTHTFDLLGSGKVKVNHHLQAEGFAGRRYRMSISKEALAKKRRRFESYVASGIYSPLEGSVGDAKKDLIAAKHTPLEGDVVHEIKNSQDNATTKHTPLTPLKGGIEGYELIDWFVDFKSGYRWNEKLWHQRVPTGHAPGADIKVPWELSRMQHLSVLGRAYHLTHDAKYAREFALQILDWISSNPQSSGLHWARAMEVALRAMNWIFSAHFFFAAPELREPFWKELLKSLYQHGEFIARRLEISFDPRGNRLTANHYLAGLAGLALLGNLFRATRPGSEWLKFGARALHAEMESQVYSDGVHFEASTHYHRFAAELFLCATLAASRAGMHFAPAYLDRLNQMIAFIVHTTKPDGSRPLIGDNDDGGLPIFDDEGIPPLRGVSFARWLSVIVDCEDSKRDIGVSSWRRVLNNTPLQGRIKESKAFPESGIYVLRQRDDYMIVDCGPCGQNGNGGHAHNDTLSFELSSHGVNFIVDPGTFVYTASAELRNQFRGTAFHNTVVVDREEMNEFQSNALFCLKEAKPPEVLKFEIEASYDYLEAQHFGYCRLADPVVHRRRILFNKAERFWVINDLLLGKAVHEYELHFHFAPLAVRTVADELLAIAESNGVTLAVFPFDKERVRMKSSQGWIAPQYGRRVASAVVQYSAAAAAPFSFTTIFCPMKDDQPLDLVCTRAQVRAFCARINKAEVLLREQWNGDQVRFPYPVIQEESF
jgi:hypothetical protein